GARLSHALRRDVVDGDPVARLPPRRAHPKAGADLPRAIRVVLHARRSRAAPRPERERAALALRRGAAHRRGHAPARDARRGPLRGHEPHGELLMAAVRPILFPPGPLPWLKPAVLTGGLVPLAAIGLRLARGALGANPIAEALNELGLMALVFLVASLACTP